MLRAATQCMFGSAHSHCVDTSRPLLPAAPHCSLLRLAVGTLATYRHLQRCHGQRQQHSLLRLPHRAHHSAGRRHKCGRLHRLLCRLRWQGLCHPLRWPNCQLRPCRTCPGGRMCGVLCGSGWVQLWLAAGCRHLCSQAGRQVGRCLWVRLLGRVCAGEQQGFVQLSQRLCVSVRAECVTHVPWKMQVWGMLQRFRV